MSYDCEIDIDERNNFILLIHTNDNCSNAQ